MTATVRPLLYASLWSIIDGRYPMISYESAVDRIHLDVMEAEYCGSDLFLDFHPNQHLSDVSLMLDVHLMIQDPEDWVERCTYRDRLASLSIHLDSRQTLDRCLTSLQRLGIEAGIVVRLDDDWELIAHYAERSDLVVVMGTPIGVRASHCSRRRLIRSDDW